MIETARAISKLGYWAGLRDDPDVSTFVAIDSETDKLPVGEVRQYWAAHALEKEDVEIGRAERLYAATAKQAAEALVQRLSWALDARRRRRDESGS